MKSKMMAADLAALLRARNALIWISTREEARVEGYIFEAAASAGYAARTWDVAAGVCEIGGRKTQIGGTDPGDTLNAIQTAAESGRERGVWIMRDLAPWLEGPIGITTTRALRNLARMLPGVARDSAQAVVVLTPRASVPEELAGHATVIEWPLPDREEIADVLDAAVEALPDEMQIGANGAREAAIDAAVGLTGEEAAACYARSLVQLRRIDPTLVASEKKRVVARERVLEWLDALPGGLDQVGGLDLLKSWLGTRALAYSPAARAYGLPAPKGALLIGISGNGKTLSARAIATAWGVPLLKLDLGALKSKWVGQSEASLRKAFGVIGTIGRCVILIDEIEKSLAGATQGAADGGVSADALGAILSWMSDRESQAFIVATANDVSVLPPEILRKGRFDEIFWVDLPTPTERAEILLAALRTHGRDGGAIFNSNTDITRLVDATEGFTGAEIASLVPDALFAAFADGGREIDRDDLLAAAGTVVPLSKTAAEKIERLRAWAQGRARPATSAEVVGTAPVRRRALDL